MEIIRIIYDRYIHINSRINGVASYLVVVNFATTVADGKIYQVDYYNLDVIISVSYRVKSKRGTQFRILRYAY